MLAENPVEEFETQEDEQWCDPQDLQRDLHLAAELGKTLLDRNTELEEALQQMYATNQEQLQEIEYLAKQVDQLRQRNEQHAKVYEQLDVTARELEDTNSKLVADSKASQQKILSLTETIKGLQANIDHLQSQVEALKSASTGSAGAGQREPRQAPSLASLKELYDLRQHFVYDHVFAERIAAAPSQPRPEEEENRRLQGAVQTLQAQLGRERRRRGALEEELGLVLRENEALRQELAAAGAHRARALELEAEVAEMRRALRPERPFANGVEGLVPDGRLLEEMLLPAPEAAPRPLRRSSSETALSGRVRSDVAAGHEETCIRRAQVVKRRGVSLLHEVDTQYSALKAKYEELLRMVPAGGDAPSHKAVQTARAPYRDPAPEPPESPEPGADAGTPEPAGSPTSTPPPEYKALFREIFSCIQKTKQEIQEQRTKFRALPSPS